MVEHKVGKVDDFEEGAATHVQIGQVPLSVFKIDDEFYAIHDLCPHKNLPFHLVGDEQIVSEESKDEDSVYVLGHIDEEELSVNCPWHNLTFDLETGYNALLDHSVPTFDVKVDGEDVYIIE